jgi:hypothetical protein
MADTHGDRAFDEVYYKTYGGGPGYVRDRSWLDFFGRVADRIVADIAPRKVLDAGCAIGILVETLRDRGVDAHGIDVSAYAIERVHPPVRPFCRQGSIAEDLGGPYDLIVTIEVLEHMTPAESSKAIAAMCAKSNDVLFSSSPFDLAELSHLNVQPPEYWAEQFARHGFFRDVDFDASFINAWAVRFRRRAEPVHRIVREYERRFAMLEIERNEIRKRALELQRQLAERQAPLSRKAYWAARRMAGRLLRLLGVMK